MSTIQDFINNLIKQFKNDEISTYELVIAVHRLGTELHKEETEGKKELLISLVKKHISPITQVTKLNDDTILKIANGLENPFEFYFVKELTKAAMPDPTNVQARLIERMGVHLQNFDPQARLVAFQMMMETPQMKQTAEVVEMVTRNQICEALAEELKDIKDTLEKYDEAIDEKMNSITAPLEELKIPDFEVLTESLDIFQGKISNRADRLKNLEELDVSSAFAKAREQIFKEEKITDPSLIEFLTSMSDVDKSMKALENTLDKAETVVSSLLTK